MCLGYQPRRARVAFDLDGGLIQTASVHAAAWKEMFDDYLRVKSQRHGETFVPFDPVADYDTYVDDKPTPDAYLAAAPGVGVAAAEAAGFEDALAGVEAGRAGRFGFVVGVDRVDQGDALRRHGADVVTTNVAALLDTP